MNNPILSILIPTTPDRQRDLSKLISNIIEQQYTRKVDLYDRYGLSCSRYWDFMCPIEILIFSDDKKMTIGQKRDLLYKEANGLYSLQIDSDDDIADNGIELILEAIKNNPGVDCITYRENCMMNGKYYSSNHSLKYDDWADNFDGFDYVRTPFYKDVIRTDIAKSVPFEHIRYGEDHAWARSLKPHLKTEAHIDEEIYFYIHESKPEDYAKRYGIK